MTALGTGVDGTVRRIDRSYEVRGMVASVTSYDDPDPGEGTVLNQVVREYNDFGLLTKEYQEHNGAKDANTLYVQYNYADAQGGLRLESVRYPNGRLVHYTYGSAGSAADNLNRLDAIKADNPGVPGTPGDTLVAYTYLGLGTVVVEDFVEAQVKLDYWGGTSGTYQGFDRFGRVTDQVWTDYGENPDVVIEEYKYGYDRAGNRLWRENVVSGDLNPAVDLDELYSYDEVYRLVGAARGNLDFTDPDDPVIETGTGVFGQDWGLDATGNWDTFNEDEDGDGDADLAQTREHNEVNETGTIGATQGPDWADPVYDAAGNMTTLPKPSAPANSIHAKYDAWNRLIKVKDGAVTVATYAYDGLGRRILKATDSDSPADPDGIDTYEHVFLAGQQVIETRETAVSTDQPEAIQPKYQQVWSPRYIDALVLRDENTDADGLCDDGRLYYLSDANFNVTALIDATGAVVERYVYTAYGEATIYDSDWSETRNTS